jgi:hypothetical protein
MGQLYYRPCGAPVWPSDKIPIPPSAFYNKNEWVPYGLRHPLSNKKNRAQKISAKKGQYKNCPLNQPFRQKWCIIGIVQKAENYYD